MFFFPVCTLFRRLRPRSSMFDLSFTLELRTRMYQKMNIIISPRLSGWYGFCMHNIYFQLQSLDYVSLRIQTQRVSELFSCVCVLIAIACRRNFLLFFQFSVLGWWLVFNFQNVYIFFRL